MKFSDKNRILFFNTIAPFILEVVTVVSGFILPRLIMAKFGSDVNGLTQSITQFLSIISFMEMGVGSVIQFNLYKPLATKDRIQYSKVVVAANKFFRTLAIALIFYTLLLMFTYPFISSHQFSPIYSAMLIAAMSISFFSQYYFGQVNQLILIADQKGYIQYFSQIITVVLNTVACVILINAGAGIHLVKLSTSLIFLLRPIYLEWYVRKNYNIDYKIKYTEEPIKQKWNGIAQHISYVVLENTDVIVLTSFATLSDVSIYAAYYMVANGIKKLISTSVSGIQARLGNIIAREAKEELNRTFSFAEWIIHTVAVILFGCTTVLIVPFILVYTKGISDANYNVPLFGLLITIANAGHSLRLPYSCVILSGGHYKQTQWSYIFAAVLNLLISIVLVYKFGLIGVAIGTIIAMLYQTIWMAYYSYKNILTRKISLFWKQLLTDIGCFLTIIFVSNLFGFTTPYNYRSWLVLAIENLAFVIIIVGIFNIIIYPQNLKKAILAIRK